MVIHMTELCILNKLSMTLTFTEGYWVTRKLELVQSFRCTTA